MNSKIILMSAAVLSLAACATKPKPEPIVQTQTQQPVTAPVVSQPAPAAPVVQAPIQAPIVQAAPQGPQAGTLEHFRYVSGEDRVYFGYNQYSLTPKTREVLRAQAGWLQEYNSAILVVGGNADERGTREYNLALGARRADAVKAFLVSQGVNPSRITTVSYGKERPIDGRSNEAAWAMNRNAHSAVLVGGNS